MDFDFRRRKPGQPLARIVESFWYARGRIGYRRERIAPTGSTVAVIVLGPPIIQTPNNGRGETLRAERGLIVGPHDQPVINEPTGETFAVGIVTTAIGCQALFGIQPSRIRGKAVDLEAAWPEATGLRSKLLRCDDPEHMLDVLDERLNFTPVPEHPSLLRCERAVELLEGDPTRPISEIAAELGVSHSHLDREMARIVGLSPRALARLLRMRRLLALIDIDGSIDWAGLAARFGWFDQSHFIRDFKRHTGVAPSRYVAAQRTHFTEDEHDAAAGFVPEL